ncbi:hypothetical protein [Methanimicrococcus hacksteinii]|uniref:hypothetical protein n=1 Tax=Methanimicrococcus hacksteinii TaxID=3028293 RepID=UPI00298ED8C6|nr:hypothetical protein [Methanimicrococcus sp. At1]
MCTAAAVCTERCVSMCIISFLSHPLATRAWTRLPYRFRLAQLPYRFRLARLPYRFRLAQLPYRFRQYSCRLAGLSAAATVAAAAAVRARAAQS